MLTSIQLLSYVETYCHDLPYMWQHLHTLSPLVWSVCRFVRVQNTGGMLVADPFYEAPPNSSSAITLGKLASPIPTDCECKVEVKLV